MPFIRQVMAIGMLVCLASPAWAATSEEIEEIKEIVDVAVQLDAAIEAYLREDYATVLTLLRPLAEQGEVAAQRIVGQLCYFGKGTSKDDQQARIWFELAAQQEDRVAQSFLGNIYAFGTGVRRDDKAAVRWYRLAAEQGDDRAQYILGARVDPVSGDVVEG